ncbi:ankyrin repeat-containing protein [Brazilian marseillevirus]|uniref:ankyrin repeat-containing protein n=1 Tax=Brazilian marseillevirus TaxID=1813599 RepID=UPI0007829657|nr:ankyrin repeat-containing protein [Brazilian marseillevirus]AMQ10886.1 ankyrin repeat-containing protein [Brazilian marseillevirus]
MKRQIQKSVWQALQDYDTKWFDNAVRSKQCIPNSDKDGLDVLSKAIDLRFSDAVLAMCACGFQVFQHHVDRACVAFEEDEFVFFPKPRKIFGEPVTVKKLSKEAKGALWMGDDSKLPKDFPLAEKAEWVRYSMESLRFLLAAMRISEFDAGWKRLPSGLRNKRILEFNTQFSPNTRYFGLGKKDFLFYAVTKGYVACSRAAAFENPPKTNAVVFAIREYAKNVAAAIKLAQPGSERFMLHGRLPENIPGLEDKDNPLRPQIQRVLNSLEIVDILAKFVGQDQLNSSWEGTTPMLTAVETRSSILLEKLIKRGSYLNFVPRGAQKLPLTACRDAELSGILALNGANPDLPDANGDNWFSWSVRCVAEAKDQRQTQRSTELLRVCVDSRPNPDVPLKENPLVVALKTDSMPLVEMVLSSGINPTDGIFWAKDNGMKTMLDRLNEYKKKYDLSLDDLVSSVEDEQRAAKDAEKELQKISQEMVGKTEEESAVILPSLIEAKRKRTSLRKEVDATSNILRLFLLRSQMDFSDSDLSRPRGIATCLSFMGENRKRVDYQQIRDKRAMIRLERYAESKPFEVRELPDGSDAGDFSDDQLFFFWKDKEPRILATWDIPSITNGDRKGWTNSEIERLGSVRIATRSPGLEQELEFLFSRQLMGARTLISFKEQEEKSEEEIIVGKDGDIIDSALEALQKLRI